MPLFPSEPASWLTSWGVTGSGLPLARFGGFQIRISASLLLAAAALGLFAIAAATSPGNGDLPRVVGLGLLFWLSGLLLQALTYGSTSAAMGSPLPELCLGVLGVDTRPRRWPAGRSLLVALATVTSLIALGSVYRLIEGGWNFPQIIRSSPSDWTAPSIGLGPHDSIWKGGAYLCWAQAILQLYPLPRTLGRQMMGALTSLCCRGMELAHQVTVFRRCLAVTALLTMLVTIVSAVRGMPVAGVPWVLLLVVSLMLWISSRSADVRSILSGHDANSSPTVLRERQRRRHPPVAAVRSLGRRVQRWRQQRRLREVQRREQEEAVDAKKLDEILTKLHDEGIESLSVRDRRVLQRVSESLRRQRETLAKHEPHSD